MSKIEIKNRWTDSILFEYEKENNTLKDTIEKAIEEGACLVGADLEGACLVGANLVGAYLERANLVGANLEGANLEGACLVGADLVGANLERAYLEGACLVGADLEGACLVGANLVGAYLERASLVRAYLEGANLVEACLVRANLEGANLVGANLERAYIYMSDNKIDEKSIVKDFEEKNNVKITDYYINRNVIPTRWNAFWKYGLIICDWEIQEKEESVKENNEIEEIKQALNKLNETFDKAYNKLIKERVER